ncbi:MAG: hypothetical protein OHK93_005716 [Ramalina farinacea]|uniref:Heterokaryon incompatibility domain-containing protein n=1 Tax=Ramalina farinacea TaxID=258253 RepID=A0AA43QH70_9LECA|nr:hypothetical protein [Ramalina farinacea]
MDHLPYPSAPGQHRLEVSNLVDADEVIDCRSDSPHQQFKAAITSETPETLSDLTRVLQHWLYFGLISRCVGEGIAVWPFDDHGRLNSRTLPGLLKSIQRSSSELATELKTVESDLRQFVTDIPKTYRTAQTGDRTVAEEVVLSIRVLVDSVWRVLHNDAEHAEVKFMRHHEKYENDFASAALCEKCQHQGNMNCEMLQAPLNDIMKILGAGGIPLIRLESNQLVATRAKYGLPYVAATHVWAGGLGNPKGNAMPACQLREMAELTASSRKAIQSLEPGTTPEQVLPAVWETIVNPLRLIPEPSPDWFWIDTLNIPRTDESQESQEENDIVWKRRTNAIDVMTQTYAAADSAIVLDPQLRQLQLKWYQRTTDPDSEEADLVLLEIFSWILVSSWMTRCWTFQEGAMAKELLVKLSEHLFPMRLARQDTLTRNRRRLQNSEYSDLHDMLDESSSWFSRLPATREVDGRVGRKEISEGDSGQPEVFTRIWNDLAARSTSRTMDRLAIFSLLVDIRPSEVRKQHPRARLKAIFKAQERLPLALLFQPPLTTSERHEAFEEFRKEEQAELDRGKTLGQYREDDAYPLPTSIRSKPLPGQLGWMQQEGNYVCFDNELLDAGLRRPSLFSLPKLPSSRCPRYRFRDSSVPCGFSMSLHSVPEVQRTRLSKAHDVFLLIGSSLESKNAFQSSDSSFCGVLLTLESRTRRKDFGTPGEVWSFGYLCHVTCDSSETCDQVETDIRQVTFSNNFIYRFRCDFSSIQAPSRHRIRGFVPPWITVFTILSTVMPLLFVYYLACLGIACIVAFAHTPGTFPEGWLAMIGFLFVMRILFFTWNSFRDYSKAANEIHFNSWVNGIEVGSAKPIIESQEVHTGLNINLTLRDSSILALLSVLFIVVGGVVYEEKDWRWMIAVGASAIGELVLRFGLEHCLPTSRFWGPMSEGGMPEHPALRESFLSASRLTKWLRQIDARRLMRGSTS